MVVAFHFVVCNSANPVEEETASLRHRWILALRASVASLESQNHLHAVLH